MQVTQETQGQVFQQRWIKAFFSQEKNYKLEN